MWVRPRHRKTNIQILYDKVAPKWGRDCPKVRDDLISGSLIVQLARRFGAQGIILDCGCGDGNLSRLTSSFAMKVVGLDISHQMLLEARQRSVEFKNVEYVEGDMLTMSKFIKPESIDLCLGAFAVCCMKDKKELLRVFRQMHTVLKTGGVALVQIPHPLDSFLAEPSAWFRDIDSLTNYFGSGQMVRRELRTTDGDVLLAARYHFPICDYFKALNSAGFIVKDMYEPKPPLEVLKAHPSLLREFYLPSSLIFVGTKP